MSAAESDPVCIVVMGASTEVDITEGNMPDERLVKSALDATVVDATAVSEDGRDNDLELNDDSPTDPMAVVSVIIGGMSTLELVCGSGTVTGKLEMADILSDNTGTEVSRLVSSANFEDVAASEDSNSRSAV
jgi:hypothetical protein